jgi:hypothetical protein
MIIAAFAFATLCSGCMASKVVAGEQATPTSTVVWVSPACIEGTCFCLFHNRGGVHKPLSVISGGQSTVVVSTLPKTTVQFVEVPVLKPLAPAPLVFTEIQPLSKSECTCQSPQYVIEHTHKRGLFGPKSVTKVFGVNGCTCGK